ncbi:hypothetical protein Vsou_09670 [Vulcanisaeta souniana JCM 11219]|uniref:Uncharacterized protein n=2 Tax=Vulcanisaeta souniana JCM 11219 TaxID=1293586 RepID=A0ABM8BLI7_9CREN|nr:hypothetical protein Vsou_09670 [Vulcanisaeta souniana JCM 11219]
MPACTVTGMGPIRYIITAAALIITIAALVVMAQSQYGNTQSTINTHDATNTTQIANCTQYGEFQVEIQCGEQVGIQTNVTAHNVTGGLPYQYEDETEYETSMVD